jgi:hypothetical protein
VKIEVHGKKKSKYKFDFDEIIKQQMYSVSGNRKMCITQVTNIGLINYEVQKEIILYL